MTDGRSKQFPYIKLGIKLKTLREKEHESIPDVSGAVEIESEHLVEIEEGSKLPSEDILLLLISHFSLQNEEAMTLWKLAGYDNLNDNQPVSSDNLGHQPAVFILPIDARVVYTDMVQISVNNFGLVVNFQQSNHQKNSQPLTVSRVGMSKEHAENVVSILQRALKDKPLQSKKSNSKPENKKNTKDNNK